MNIEQIIQTAIKAGEKIMEIYNSPDLSGEVDYKSDKSPLTLADTESNNIIVNSLKDHYSNIPIISEEGKDIPWEIRKNYTNFWLVDPLDGTKEFINRNGEFTVNIALVENNYPVAGVIYVPVQESTYFCFDGKSYLRKGSITKELNVNNAANDRTAVRSRSHASEEEEKIYEKYGVSKYISKGSSLKFCEVASGNADLYYRHGPTMEWDTAAGQAILEGAGGKVYFGNTEEKRFRYNKESLLNPGFLCLGF